MTLHSTDHYGVPLVSERERRGIEGTGQRVRRSLLLRVPGLILGFIAVLVFWNFSDRAFDGCDWND